MIQQFIIRSRLLLEQLDNRYTPQEEIEILTQAIRLTVPDFNTEEIEKKLYTRDEIKIINQIANAYSCAGNQKKRLIFSINCSNIFGNILRKPLQAQECFL